MVIESSTWLKRSLPPLRQYEVALQNAEHALLGLLELPARPWLCFEPLVAKIRNEATELTRRAAACRIQRQFRVRGQRPASPPQADAALMPKAPAVSRQGQGRPLGRRQQAAPAVPAGVDSPLASPCDPAAPSSESPQAATDRSSAATPPLAHALPSYDLCCATKAQLSQQSGALNPLEKRRRMVASQLAVANPARLARSRRRELMRDQQPGACPAARTAPSLKLAGAEVLEADGLAATAPVDGQKVPQSPGARAVSREIAAQLAVKPSQGLLESLVEATGKPAALAPPSTPRGGTAEDELLASLRQPLAPSEAPARAPSPRRPPVEPKLISDSFAPASEVVTKGAATTSGNDFVLQDARLLQDDPLEAATMAGMFSGAGLSMAPPPPALVSQSRR
eukprot:TRINITY_DN38146_c0_g1_i1.p1 TRINITY_DN38146_c0_g1~~TRINITY_DN38146_c0_g1_i1.p1  ORF type:complete len:410 (+),score=69.52 TRINITY_DN38146_c0_g1_i1:44-1231(+)